MTGENIQLESRSAGKVMALTRSMFQHPAALARGMAGVCVFCLGLDGYSASRKGNSGVRTFLVPDKSDELINTRLLQ